MKPTALIFGVSGQDGSYLAEFLLSHGYHVIGTTRSLSTNSFYRLKYLSVFDKLCLIELDLLSSDEVLNCLAKYQPSEIYHLSGQSSVGSSFSNPNDTINSFVISTLNILEGIRKLSFNTRFYSASSSECFGSLQHPADESTSLSPVSPYGYAKTMAHNLIACYRTTYDLFAVSGFLFNHDSELRPDHFVTQKVARSVAQIYLGKLDHIVLGNTTIVRDWGYAPDYIKAMWLMLQHHTPEDFCICTNSPLNLMDYITLFFDSVNLSSYDFVRTDKSLFRPSEIKFSSGSSAKALSLLNWSATVMPRDIASRMVLAQLDKLS